MINKFKTINREFMSLESVKQTKYKIVSLYFVKIK